ncbi:MAG: TetR/AcrR family transcriptional regulator [Anaerolineae bacterium]
MESRKEQRRNETIAQIKLIATQQMAEMGATNISLRGIARQMGLSAPALYRYFPNYEALITALIVDSYHSMADAIESAEGEVARDDFGGRFLAGLHAMRDWALVQPAEYMLIQGTPIPGYEGPEAITRPAAQRSWRVMFIVLIEAQAAGKLKLPAEFQRELPNYAAFSELWSEQIGVPISVPLLHVALSSAALINGLLIVEVSDRYPGVAAETTLLELDLLRKRLGLPNPFDDKGEQNR